MQDRPAERRDLERQRETDKERTRDRGYYCTTMENTNQWPYRHLRDAFTVADKSNTQQPSASPKKQQGRKEKAPIDIF